MTQNTQHRRLLLTPSLVALAEDSAVAHWDPPKLILLQDFVLANDSLLQVSADEFAENRRGLPSLSTLWTNSKETPSG